jgi:hypothetical protein
MRIPTLFMSLAATVALAQPDPAPEFTKDDARRILAAQEWENITVVAVVNGVSREKVASSSLSHALALAYRDGKWQDLKFDVYYDRDLGWFTYECANAKFRIWTRDGYREIERNIGWR